MHDELIGNFSRSLLDPPRNAGPSIRLESCAALIASIECLPMKPTGKSEELRIPKTTMQDHMRKDLNVKYYPQVSVNELSDNDLNIHVYLKLIKELLVPELTADGILNTVILHQDGTPPHFALSVHRRLNERFLNRWIGLFGPMNFDDQQIVPP
ncbi:hypothetical protein J6590_026567 [Homalodisca vitripennis]|nr:hypothetical protein J6590_026567 [Homalodisca vitripennis]